MWVLEHKKVFIEKYSNQRKELALPSYRKITSQEVDIVVQKSLDSMGELTDEFHEDDSNNQSLLAIVEAKEGYTLALISNPKEKNQ